MVTLKYGNFKIGMFLFEAGEILRICNPIAFEYCYRKRSESWKCLECKNDKFDNKEDAELCCQGDDK